MREPRVIVGLRTYDGKLPDIDVEVFADNPEGREVSEMFLQADAGISDSRLIENNRVSAANSLTVSYDMPGSIEEIWNELRGTEVEAERTLRWLVDNVDADEAYRILITARRILHEFPGNFTAAQATEVAAVWERG